MKPCGGASLSNPKRGNVKQLGIMVLIAFGLPLIVAGTLYASTTVTIPSTQPWTDTGLNVSPGDVISISASGTVIFADPHTPENTTGPDGKTGPSGGCSFVVTNAAVPAQALIGNIANSASLDGKGFFVGSSFNGTVPIANTTTQSGKLFLGFNDSAVFCDRSGYDAWGFGGDNHGSFTATITITSAPTDTVSITSGPSASSSTVASGGTVSLSVTATDSLGHTLSYAWSALCAGLSSNGNFSNASAQNPSWTAPTNATGSAQSCTLTVTASDGGFGHSDTKSVSVTVSSETPTTGTLTVTARRSDTNAALTGATVSLSGGPSSPASQTTGGDGATTFSNLLVGTYTVTAGLAGFQSNSTSATVTANVTTQVTVFLSPSSSNQPTLISVSPDHGTPNLGVTVTLEGTNFVGGAEIIFSGGGGGIVPT